MKNRLVTYRYESGLNQYDGLYGIKKAISQKIVTINLKKYTIQNHTEKRAEILFITSYPPRECGIATYSQDLIRVLNNQFSHAFSINVCALESGDVNYTYPNEVKYILKTSLADGYEALSSSINKDNQIKIVMVQHEFGFFKTQEKAFVQFLYALKKPVALVFHTVLPHPDDQLKSTIKLITEACESISVMTDTSAAILINDYGVPKQKIVVIAHGTHLVQHANKSSLKISYGLKGRKVLTTFGLLSPGKSIETTLNALPAIIKQYPDILFLIIGKTHPEVVKTEGEMYRQQLERQIIRTNLQDHVLFINNYLTLPELLDYLQLTDIYLFTTNDPNQAVSGTFVYAMSCACPIISTPIPHAKEVLTKDTGIIFDFQNDRQLAEAVIRLLNNEPLRKNISTNALQKIVSSAWENSAIAHAQLFAKMAGDTINLQFNLPVIKLDHLKEMTTNMGILQFSKINQPDLSSGYTLDDNARALIAMAMYYKQTRNEESIPCIYKYLSFIRLCQQPDGRFLNYVDKNNKFTCQNSTTNLDDSNGRAIWALGYIISLKNVLPIVMIAEAESIIEKSFCHLGTIHSTRAMAFAIKGLYYYQSAIRKPENLLLINIFANRLIQMYKHESNEQWTWFESYLTYANSILPEAMLYAWLITGNAIFRVTALSSLHFLLSQTFNENGIEVISNKKWLQKGQKTEHVGEQPIDVAYTIMTLSHFYDVFKDEEYRLKMETAFNWFLGENRLHQIVYNPCTGGCYDGLEETHVNLNQGAESAVSYLMARLTLEKNKALMCT